MTVGQKRIDPLPVYINPSYGYQNLGRLFIKDWNGGDAVTMANPRSSYPLRPKVKGPRRRRVLPDMPYWMHIEDTNLDGFWSDTGAGYLRYFSKDTSWGSGCENVSYDARNELKLISKLRERVYGSGFSPAVFAAEGRQALRMIGNSATRIASGVSRLRARDPWGLAEALGIEPQKGFIRNFSDARRSLSSLWLEVSYGWQPLLKDAEEGAKYLADMLVEKVPAPIRVRKVWSETSSGIIGQYNSGFKGRVDIHELTLTMKNWSSAPVYRPNLYTVAEVAWEKLPYSFVFDWFVPVGSLLNALKTREDLSGTFIRTLKTTSVGTDWSIGSGFTMPPVPHLGLPDRKIWITLNRSVSSELQVPGIRQFITDDIATYKSWRHAANAVALLSQRKLSSVVGGRTSLSYD